MENTLEERVLNSNMSDEDKIVLIKLIGKFHENVAYMYFPYLTPVYRDYTGAGDFK